MVAGVLALGACGGDDDSDGSPSSTTAPATAPASASTAPTGDVGIVETIEGFEYYNPCADSPIDIDGTQWYRVFDEEVAALDAAGYPTGPEGLVRIMPPGPGDDIGTMVVYDDGIARYESESGMVSWFTTDERTYTWVC